jgi:hypothetical protein
VAALTPPFFDTSVLLAGLIEPGKASEFPWAEEYVRSGDLAR